MTNAITPSIKTEIKIVAAIFELIIAIYMSTENIKINTEAIDITLLT